MKNVRIKITREDYQKNVTIGFLEVWLDEVVCSRMYATIELPWLNNMRNISCIPVGTYPAEIYLSPTKGKCILLSNVPNRSYIEIHVANFTRELRGCFAIGYNHKDLDRDGIIDVQHSRKALNELLKLVEGRKITVEVCEQPHSLF